MSITSKIAMGFMGLMLLGTVAGKNSRPNASAQSTSSLEQLASDYTNTAHSTSCHVSFDRFAGLSTGMSYDEAAGTLGCQGREESRSDMAGYSTVMYGWDGSGMIGANMNAMFQNDHLVTKSQFGLR